MLTLPFPLPPEIETELAWMDAQGGIYALAADHYLRSVDADLDVEVPEDAVISAAIEELLEMTPGYAMLELRACIGILMGSSAAFDHSLSWKLREADLELGLDVDADYQFSESRTPHFIFEIAAGYENSCPDLWFRDAVGLGFDEEKFREYCNEIEVPMPIIPFFDYYVDLDEEMYFMNAKTRLTRFRESGLH
jgi:hypothetical protein